MFYCSDINSVMRRREHSDCQYNFNVPIQFSCNNQFTHLKRYSPDDQFSLRYMDFINKLPSILAKWWYICCLCYAILIYTHVIPLQHLHSYNVKLYFKNQNVECDGVPVCRFCFKDILNAPPFESDASP